MEETNEGDGTIVDDVAIDLRQGRIGNVRVDDVARERWLSTTWEDIVFGSDT